MIEIRSMTQGDRAWVERTLTAAFASPIVAARGRVYEPAAHEGFVAWIEREPMGVVTYQIGSDGCEITSLVSTREGIGAGTRLLDAIGDEAARRGCSRIWLITTNDNLRALRFYQRRGFSITAVYRSAVDYARRSVKPEIPPTGQHEIPIRDEIELERRLDVEEFDGPPIMFPHRLRFGVAAGGIVLRDGKVLLVRHKLDDGRDFWVMPGGGVERDESLPDSACREVLEETGLEVASVRLAYIEQFRERHGTSFKLWFVCREVRGEQSIKIANPDSYEQVLEARFMGRDELAGLVVYPPIFEGMFWDDLDRGFPEAKFLEPRPE